VKANNYTTSKVLRIKKPDKIIYRTLGKTGIKMPIVSMGVMRADNPNLVKAALDSGIEHLDTAHGYQNGKNEEMIGKVLKDYSRDSYTIATKVPGDGMDRKTGKFTEETSPEAFIEKFNKSLERLQLDYVDILYLHGLSTREAVLFEPLLNAMKKLKQQEKIKHIGLSTHRNEPEVIRAAVESNVYEVVLTSYNFIKDNHTEIKNAIAEAANAGLGVVAMKTMSGGFFDREKTKPVNAKAALKWALQDENVHTSIPGYTTYEQLEESLSVMNNLKLSKKEKKDLIINKDTGSLYCPGCMDCTRQCKMNLQIPDLMRAYMYAYGYSDLALAQDVINDMVIPGNACDDCSDCSVKCRSGFNVPEKIKDIIRVKDIPRAFIG
jgi:predicted aldo/keto reductase-like oxidoreductase